MSALLGYLIIGALSFISRLPESLLVAIARAWGRVGPRVMRTRAAMARKNLTRVYTYRDGVAPTSSALNRGIELLFEHHVRFYIETARAPRHARKIIATRVRIENEDSVRAAFTRASGGAIFLAAHFGAIELPGSILADRSGMKPVAPMEELGNPVLQRWMLRVRGEGLGLRIIRAQGAAAVMSAELAAGGIVGLVGDRNISGRGVPVSLFGASARLPIGAGLLAVESGARLFVAAVIREDRGLYTGYIRQVEVPTDGDRMERTRAALVGVAAAFEELISKAPEQWWTLFYPIWDDLPS
jgi:phosphatidylinositol dimannoside acyltransferase